MKAKISRSQFFFLIPNLLFGKAIGVTAGVMVRKIGIDTWTSMLFGFVFGTLIVLIMTYLGSKFPDKTIIEYSEELLGKWVGKGIGIILTLFFIVAFATSANTMILHFKLYFLQETPFLIICIIYIALCMYGIYLGFEVVVRFSLIGFVMIMAICISMILGTIADFRIINLQPILEGGVLSNITNSFYSFSDIAMVIFAIGILYPMLNNKKKVNAITFWSMVVGSLFVIIWPFFETGVMGPDIMGKYILCCMEQVRCAQFTKYLPRYELLMVSFFIFGMIVQSSAMAYCAKYSIKQITGIKKDLYIIIPLGIVLTVVTYYMAADYNNFVNFISYPWSQICAILGISLPLFLFFAALLRGKLDKQE